MVGSHRLRVEKAFWKTKYSDASSNKILESRMTGILGQKGIDLLRDYCISTPMTLALQGTTHSNSHLSFINPIIDIVSDLINAALYFLSVSMIVDLDLKNVFRDMEKDSTKNRMVNLFSELVRCKSEHDKDKVGGLLEKFRKQGYMSDGAGWNALIGELILNLYQSKYEGVIFEAAHVDLEAHLQEANRKANLTHEFRVGYRNVDFARSIRNLYFAGIKQGKDLYVRMDGNHAYGMQRLLKHSVSELSIEFEFSPGASKLHREDTAHCA